MAITFYLNRHHKSDNELIHFLYRELIILHDYAMIKF